MSRLRRLGPPCGGAVLVAACVACQAKVPTLFPGAAAVDVAPRDPPPGAKNLGPIEAASGDGCGLRGAKGSYEGAEAELRNEAEARGGDYVHVTRVVVPHVEGGCYDVRFVIRGIVYRTHAAPVPDVTAARAPACIPACSPGYACEAGTCRAECNPACEPDQTCGQDRMCRPAARP